MADEEDKELGEIIPIRLARNEQGQNSKTITLTLPEKTDDMIRKWAAYHKVTLSRAIHDLVWMGYFAEKGEFKNYAERSKK